MEITGNIKTTIVCNEDKSHVFSITKDFGMENKEEVLLLTLWPTITDVNMMDLSTMHITNHAVSDEGLGWGKITFVYLFSKINTGKVSTKGLTGVDEENLEYLRKLIESKPNAKIVISFGSSLSKNEVAIKSKMLFFKMVQEIRPNEPLWQLSAEGMNEEAPHILFAGIRYANKSFYLSHYIVPKCFTPEGYEAFLAAKAVKRELFVQNVLNKKKRVNEEVAEGEEAKGKKNGNKKS